MCLAFAVYGALTECTGFYKGTISMKTRLILVSISIANLVLITAFVLMFFSYFGDIYGRNGFAMHQSVAHLGYLLSLGQMDYLLQHWVSGVHVDFQRWVGPVYTRLSVLFIFWLVFPWAIWQVLREK